MRSTFHGLETGRRALFTQQTALHTTGHNIANANTAGFSRQRVNFSQTEAFPKPGLNMPGIPGQLGTGVKAGAIQRIREGFLDTQFRAETSKFGYWDSRQVALRKMEDVMNEPTEDGLAKTLDRFWSSLQDLSVHPEDSGARSVVRQRGMALAETFNYTADSLKAVQRDMKEQINVTLNEVNSLARQINNLNKQIASVEPHGYLPNDLYDQRDLLVDRLSQIANVKVERVGSGGQSLEIAEGKYTVKLIDDNGRDMGVTLVDGRRLEANEMRVAFHEGTGLVEHVYVASANALKDPNFDYKTSGGVNIFDVDTFRAVGKLKADLEAYGYVKMNNGLLEQKGLYPEMLRNLDQMVFTFVQQFNAVHSAGWNLTDIASGVHSPVDFFDFGSLVPSDGNFQGAASSLRVSDKIMSHLDNIAASKGINGEAFSGDGSNALLLANVKDANLDFGGTTTNVMSFYQGVIGDMAVNTNEAERMTRNSDTLRLSVDQRRESVSGVSLDEEMTNLIQFQHAYNAAARTITMVDEMLDKIINGMGLVGR
ncbi:MAG: flagellar hook-associated protein FlgK [Anaerobacillus sp.]|uniref:flagellar hook-associated protein FlgK n=1 Tax=Anaerobacillus sp. TaxID=1872506 RepID=UPI00391ADB8A